MSTFVRIAVSQLLHSMLLYKCLIWKGTLDSPEWRKGPSGPKTLCNACGLRWAKKEKKKTGPGPSATSLVTGMGTG